MSASCYLTALLHNCIPWQQLVSCSMTTPFLSAKAVACETKWVVHISYTGNCWPCGCYVFIAATVLAVAVVAVLYVNNAIPGKSNIG